MAVVSVNELWPGAGGSDGTERRRDYTRVFEVITDDPADREDVVAGPPARILGLPGNGHLHPADGGARVVKVRPARTADSPQIWQVTCEYSTELPRAQAAGTQRIDPQTGEFLPSTYDPGRASPTDWPENPLDRPPEYSWRYELTTEVAQFDNKAKPILNCAGVPYDDPPPEHEVARAVITVRKNYAPTAAGFDWLDGFVNTVNVEKWNGRAPRTCWIVGLEAGNVQVEAGVAFRPVEITIKYNRDRWDLVLMERGYAEMYLDTTDTTDDPTGTWKRRAIKVPTDTKGYPEKGPYLLNGERYPGGASVSDPAGSRVYTTYDVDIPFLYEGDPPAVTAKLSARGRLADPKQAPLYSRWRVKRERNFTTGLKI